MPIHRYRRLVAAAVLASAAIGAPAASRAADPLHTEYVVSLIGLPVGRASFDTRIENKRFSVDGTIGSAGLADILSTVAGTSRATGRIAGDRLVPDSFGLDYRSNKRVYKSDVRFAGNRVASAAVQPAARAGDDYLPVDPAQLRAVVDPLSGLMIKTAGPADELCRRTLPFFDGWSRLDLRLAPAGRKPFRTDGFVGDAVVCTARVVPISGFKPTSKGVRFIAKQTLELWFAPIGDTGIFAPVYAKVPTEIGPLTFRATRFAKE